MGTMTKTLMQDEVLFALGNRADTGATNSTRLERWIDQAYAFITHPSVHKFKEAQDIYTITLSTGTDEYSLTNATVTYDIISVRWVTHVLATAYTNTAQKRKLNPKDIRWFENKTLSTGQPIAYVVDALVLRIAQIPRTDENNQLLRVGVWRTPAIMTSSGTSALPDYFDRPIWKTALGFALQDLGDRALALAEFREAQILMNNATSENELEAEDWGFQSDIMTGTMGETTP